MKQKVHQSMNLFKYMAISFILFFSMTTQAIAEDASTSIDKSSPANDLTVEITILSELLKEENYKTPDFNQFKQRCLDYFDINISSSTKEYSQYMEGISGRYDISIKQAFLFTFGESIFYEPSNPETPTIKHVKTRLRQKNNQLAQQFIAYNKLLFNDDASVTSFFLKKDSIDFLWEVVFLFDYEKNETLYKAAIPNIATTINKISTNQHLLFYNNQQRGYKKRLLNDLYSERGTVGIEAIIDATYNNWEKFSTDLFRIKNGVDEKITINQSLQDNALLHLIKLISHHQDTAQAQTKNEQLAYSYLVKFMDKDSELEKRLKQTNYYDMGLNVLSQERRIISDKKNELIENHYITQSKDNYINFRKKPSTKSEIIKKLSNHARVIKLKTEGNWYYVQLAENRAMKGYIHITQLQYID